jgi:hypothetical protein
MKRFTPGQILFGLISLALIALLLRYLNAISALFAAQPVVAVAVAVIIVCLIVAIFGFFRNRRADWWGESGDIVVTSFVSLIAVGGGLYLIAGIGGYSEPRWQEHIIRGAIGWALAYFAAGFFGGFLFGIPRVLQDNAPVPEATNASTDQPYAQRVNTNLEQISDWLTKIIVGLGLVELRAVPDHLYKAAVWMGQSLGLKPNDDTIASFSCAFIIYFTIVGFLAGYLITRLFLAGAFWRADRRQIIKSPAADYGGTDAIATRIRNYWKPGGQVDRVRQAAMTEWLQQQRISDILPTFLTGSAYAKQRAKMVQDLNIPE